MMYITIPITLTVPWNNIFEQFIISSNNIINYNINNIISCTQLVSCVQVDFRHGLNMALVNHGCSI